ncbi:hypothetical protein FHG87_023543 [Trinorchestia longiramus]|nr:hypothetical protein FHG87_023543 [Trinorchestia longiramus]
MTTDASDDNIPCWTPANADKTSVTLTSQVNTSSKKRKYLEIYTEHGFTFITDSDKTQKPQCFMCGKVLVDDSMKPTKLREHQEKRHQLSVQYGLVVIKQKERFHTSGTLPKHRFAGTQKPMLEASYKVAYLIAKDKKPHTIGETLIKPCVLEMELVCGTEHRKEIEKIPLSNYLIQSRISDMSVNILQQVMSEMKNSQHPFSMQLDETTDYAQYIQTSAGSIKEKFPSRRSFNSSIKEKFLFCRLLITTTRAQNIITGIKDFFIAQDFADWSKNIGSIYTDGAQAMLENKSGFASFVKTLHKSLKDMSTAIQVVNFIQARPTNRRLNEVLCQDIGSLHNVLLYYTESILPYDTTYLCEAGFSTLIAIKTKSRNRLNTEDDMRVALSKTSPQFHVLENKK